MSKVIANMSMSLDGFVADLVDQVDHLFGWMGGGDVEVLPRPTGRSACPPPVPRTCARRWPGSVC